jgi:hypothetical protein
MHVSLLQVRIVKEDGAVGLFRGAGPTVVRAMALNMGMLASNDQARLGSGLCRLSHACCIRLCTLSVAHAGVQRPGAPAPGLFRLSHASCIRL